MNLPNLNLNFNLCKYKNSLGEVNKGIHSYKFMGLAIADVIMTIIGAKFISYFFKLSFFYTLIFLFISGIILHRLFCVRTTIDKLVFPYAN
jgi:uncharacterized membrane protein